MSKFYERKQSFIFSSRDHSSTKFHKQLSNPKTCELVNIIHNELNKPSHHPSISTKHIAIQCSSEDFNSQINHSDTILIGHSSCSTQSTIITTPSLPGYNERGIQVDLNDNNLDLLIEIYSNQLSSETIRHFYEVCHSDIQFTRTQIDEYLQHNTGHQIHFPTLCQLSLIALNRWNEQIKSTNPLFDTKSIDDLLEDINDDEIFDELTLENENPNIEFTNSNQINIPSSFLNSLEKSFGELPNKSSFPSNDNNGILLPFDDELSISIYQALQRFLIKSNQIIKPVNENQIKKTNQKWKLPSQNQPKSDSNTNNHIPSLRQIMNEEQKVAKSQKSKQVF